jgi:ATP-dependent helicase/nuclease subunit B
VALRQFGEERVATEKPPGAIELQGWLELAWEDAPHLIVAGMNDGRVPEAVVGDAFLPESLRERLGLKTNAARLARDTYLLQVLAAARREGGRFEVVLARVSAAGEPLRPSRLLLHGPEAELPQRVAQLFRRVEAARPNPAWHRAWKLAVPRRPPPGQVPVTGLRSWLACPFRFYLRHVLRMEAVDPYKSELDAFDFGTLCHAALEAMGREEALRGCTDEALLREFLLAELDREARRRYGEHPVVPLVIQLESARQRLVRAAAVQARENAAGWVTERVEWPLTLTLGGLEVRGRIDRIDRHLSSGAWRVLDYKTSDTAAAPIRAHLRPRQAGDEALPAWRVATIGGRDHVWIDLQLPLYLRALRVEPAAPASLIAGYFNLPKAAGETAVAPWPEVAEELRVAADACADGVAAAIQAGEFWPPAELRAEEDDFAALFHEGAAASVDWEGGA